ncbi:MAG: iron-sulfur cluster assembly accessory protein [Nanoarchaeota archaeon]
MSKTPVTKKTTAKQAITKDMTIGDIVQQYPFAAEILTAEGIHCVGCGAAFWETLSDGLMGHGATDEQIDDLVRRLNEVIPAQETKNDLTVTETAAKKVLELAQKHNKTDMGLRIKVIVGGCSGSKYSMEFDKTSGSDDVVIELLGAKFFVDKESFGKLKGAKVDYVDGLQGAGFKITNPNASKTRGCGESFK